MTGDKHPLAAAVVSIESIPDFDLVDRDGERYQWDADRAKWRHDEFAGSHYTRQAIEDTCPPVREVPRKAGAS